MPPILISDPAIMSAGQSFTFPVSTTFNPGVYQGFYGALKQCQASGQPAIDAFRSLSPLPDTAQRIFDKALLEVALERLVIVKDLMSSRLVFDLPQWWSTSELYAEKGSQIGEAIEVMDPRSTSQNAIPDRVSYRIPVYLTMETFQLSSRLLDMSARVGTPLDVEIIKQKTRRVNERIEKSCISGSSLQSHGLTVPGMLNAPNANTYTFIGGEAWDDVAHTGLEIWQDYQAMVAKLQGDNQFGPYKLDVGTKYGNRLDDLYNDSAAAASTPLTIGERLQKSKSLQSINIADRLPADSIVLHQATTDCIDLVVGQQPAVITWVEPPGWTINGAIIACIIPRVKSDYETQSGFCIGTRS